MDHNISRLARPPAPSAQFDIQSPMAFHTSKRPREHEELTAYDEEISRETKKHRPLPLRSSPRSNQRLKIAATAEPTLFPALTPVDSSKDEDMFSKRFFIESDSANAQQPQEFHDPRMDLDASMDIDICGDIGDMDEGSTGPSSIARFDNDTHQSLPTPYNIASQSPNAGHFASLSSTSVQTTDSPGPMVGARDTLCPPFALPTMQWRSPRLPSPVSDNGDTRSKHTSGDTEMADDMPSHSQQSPPLLNSAAVEAETAVMRKRLSSLDLPDQGNAEPTSSVKSAKKLAFSMGYRADCDKCRRRVPGHYSHIIRG
ncbi:hypothetical protein BJX63DRAFT_411045 [Aspergillus granulosus]|uniref:Uncharacterized protein n=1 Tax=Aspergillus granulosus TaxID=176169 RepID=A0ABR4GXH7_9EURO